MQPQQPSRGQQVSPTLLWLFQIVFLLKGTDNTPPLPGENQVPAGHGSLLWMYHYRCKEDSVLSLHSCQWMLKATLSPNAACQPLDVSAAPVLVQRGTEAKLVGCNMHTVR